MLNTYKTYNSMVRFLKYEFNNKLLGGVTLFRRVQVTFCIILSGVTPPNNLEIPLLNSCFMCS